MKNLNLKAFITRNTIIALIIGIVLGILICTLFSFTKYDYDWIIGRHYEEIIARYGEFDSGNADFVRQERKNAYFSFKGNENEFFKCENAATYEIINIFKLKKTATLKLGYPHIIIEFDENGIAQSVSKGYIVNPQFHN